MHTVGSISALREAAAAGRTKPLQLEYQSQDGTVARAKAGSDLNPRFDPDLAERVFKEAGCGLSWTY